MRSVESSIADMMLSGDLPAIAIWLRCDRWDTSPLLAVECSLAVGSNKEAEFQSFYSRQTRAVSCRHGFFEYSTTAVGVRQSQGQDTVTTKGTGGSRTLNHHSCAIIQNKLRIQESHEEPPATPNNNPGSPHKNRPQCRMTRPPQD